MKMDTMKTERETDGCTVTVGEVLRQQANSDADRSKVLI